MRNFFTAISWDIRNPKCNAGGYLPVSQLGNRGGKILCVCPIIIITLLFLVK
jgi:hypothetical protein